MRLPMCIVPGSVIRIGGIAGSGKTTLALSIINNIIENCKDYKVIHFDLNYSTTTERASKIISKESMKRYLCIEELEYIEDLNNKIIVIDPVETSDVEYIEELSNRIKDTNCILFLISDFVIKIFDDEPTTYYKNKVDLKIKIDKEICIRSKDRYIFIKFDNKEVLLSVDDDYLFNGLEILLV